MGGGLLQINSLVEAIPAVKEGWNGYNVIHDTASRVAALDLGILPSARSRWAPPAKFVYLLGSDDYSDDAVPADAFVVYQASAHTITSGRVHPGFITVYRVSFVSLRPLTLLRTSPLQSSPLAYQTARITFIRMYCLLRNALALPPPAVCLGPVHAFMSGRVIPDIFFDPTSVHFTAGPSS